VFGRRQAKTHSQLMRDELSEGFGHLWQAAAHAADGVGATVGPKWDSAKGHLPHRAGTIRDVAAQGLDSTMAAFAPLMEAARTSAMNATRKAQKAGKKARKRESGKARRRTAILVGLLTGAAAGAAGAIIARRRNRAKWEEYEAQGIDAARGYAKSALDTARTATDKGAQRVGDAAEQAAESANLFAEQTRQGVSNVAGRTGDALEQGKEKTDQFAEKAHTISKNNRN
jgi:hypothetical protein